MSGSGRDDRDEVLGERLRLALDETATRGEPDFAAIYGRSRSREASRLGTHFARRARRALFALPAAAALTAAFAVVIGLGVRRSSAADDEASVKAELRLLAVELAGTGEPEEAAPDDLFASELALFIDDLWSPNPGEID
ncbi:MAG: hypothetical protein Q8M76_13895 [Spirochaetaceae bacterium]|nr:hypothetical protein [Spirochaetaceae bacterium]